MTPVQIVKVSRHGPKSRIGKGHNDLGRRKAFVLVKLPVKAVRMNSHNDPYRIELPLLDLREKITRIYKMKSVDFPVVLRYVL